MYPYLIQWKSMHMVIIADGTMHEATACFVIKPIQDAGRAYQAIQPQGRSTIAIAFMTRESLSKE